MSDEPYYRGYFGIKAVDTFGLAWWLGPPMPNGIRMTIRRPEHADKFPTRSEAQVALGSMPPEMRTARFIYSVEVFR
jgi:hypothetical protein